MNNSAGNILTIRLHKMKSLKKRVMKILFNLGLIFVFANIDPTQNHKRK